MKQIVGFNVFTFSRASAIWIEAETYTEIGDFFVFRNVMDNVLVDTPRGMIRKTSVFGIVPQYEETEEGGGDGTEHTTDAPGEP